MPKKNEIYHKEEEILRVLEIKEDRCLIIDCTKATMPVWREKEAIEGYTLMTEEELYQVKGFIPIEEEKLEAKRRRKMQERYSLIAPVLTFIGDEKARSNVIRMIAEEKGVSGQSIRAYLKTYLILQNKQGLLPKERESCSDLTDDQKNMRWALNRFFYTFEKHSLHTAYIKMLQSKYTDETGKLKEKYPSFNQFRYFYRKTRKLENFYISRNGLTNYQRNNRPCVGDSVRAYASAPGLGMVDGTVCDIYLVNESGQVVGRPLLVSCVDAFSGICMGYSLSWEGGIYSVRDLALNMIVDKKEHCHKHGIRIEDSEWPVHCLPGRIMSDQGSEYVGHTLEQITELGVMLENLPSYRPDLKGPVEKFFDVIQGLYKKELKGKGVLEPDFQERGAHDYRKDACLTMESFEKIILRCILYYNAANILEDYPFTDDMLAKGIKPYCSAIWEYGLTLPGTNLIETDREHLILCLLPRTKGSFSRYGLTVNKLRYKNDAFKERYLSGGEAVVAYDPDNANYIWLLEKGRYSRFLLIDSRFKDKSIQEIETVKDLSKSLIRAETTNALQAEIDLAAQIQSIVETSAVRSDNSTKGIRETRKKETNKKHKNHVKEAGLNG